MLRKALFLSGALAFTIVSGSCAAQTEKSGTSRPAGSAFNFRVDTKDKPDTAKAGKCKKGYSACLVTVTVAAGKPCVVTVDPEYVVIGEKKPLDMVWQVDTKDWTFDEAKGVDIYTPGTDFTKAGRNRTNPAQYGWKFNGTAKKHNYYAYGVNLVGPKGETCSVDPGVITEWP